MIVLMGAAGAGKGTQGEMLRKQTGYGYVSTGDMLRQFASEEQKNRMLSGELLSDEEIIAMVDQALDTMTNPEYCILDGFPRTLPQVEWLIDQVETGRFQMPCVINLDIDEDTVHQRLLRRGRQDDSEEVITRRFREYQSITLPVLGRFREAGAEVFDIDADQEADIVHNDVVTALDGRLPS